jgi:hypothetical protein
MAIGRDHAGIAELRRQLERRGALVHATSYGHYAAITDGGTMSAEADIFDPRHYAAVRRPLLDAETLPPWCYTSEAFYRREVERNYYKRWDITTEEDIVASESKQPGLGSPFCPPGRFSHREPLVHEIDNWILDRVLPP